MNKINFTIKEKFPPTESYIIGVNDSETILFAESQPYFGKPPEILVFPIYSITKTFISALVLKLVEMKKINMEGLLNESMDFQGPSWLGQLKIQDLLTHRSGLGDYGGMDEYEELLAKNPSIPPERDWLIDLVVRQGLHFQPGDNFLYSNMGYLFLKEVIEYQYQSSFSEVVQEQICHPLGLENTKVMASLDDWAYVDLPGHGGLSGYEETQDIRKIYHPGWVAHGLIVSCVADINRFLLAFLAGSFITLPLREKLIQPIALGPSGDERHYGYGIMGNPTSQCKRLGICIIKNNL